MVHAFCRRGFFKGLNKSLIFHEKGLQQFFAPGIFNRINDMQKIPHHLIDVFLRHGQVIRRIEFSLFCDPQAFDMELGHVVKCRYIPADLNIIKGIVVGDAGTADIPVLPSTQPVLSCKMSAS